MIPTLTVVTPAIGRESLRSVLAAIVPQLEIGDEYQVIGDGPTPEARRIAEEFPSPYLKYDELEKRVWNWGNPQRNLAVSRATGRFIMFIDDDDEPVPGNLEIVRRLVAEHQSRPHIFRAIFRGKPIPVGRKLFVGNVGSQCLVFPNIKERLGKWSNRYAADFDFCMSTLALYPGKERDVVWHDEVICRINQSIDPRGRSD